MELCRQAWVNVDSAGDRMVTGVPGANAMNSSGGAKANGLRTLETLPAAQLHESKNIDVTPMMRVRWLPLSLRGTTGRAPNVKFG